MNYILDHYLVVVGYIYGIFIAHGFIYWIVQLMWAILRLETGEKELRSRLWQAAVVGVVDRSLFIISLQLEKPEFIAIWLTIKTVSSYKNWSDSEAGRATFNIFLAGNGLSILFSLGAAGIIKYGDIHSTYFDEKTFWLALLGPIVLSVCILIYLIYEHSREEKEINKTSKKKK